MAPGAEGKFLLFVLDGMADRPCPEPVSYTHLTLPTIYPV